jgi:hypothetical protein
MEAIRRQATEEAKAVREKNNERLRTVLQGWPEKMSPSELRALVDEHLQYDGKYQSLTYRFTRCGLLRFDADGHWHNLCNLPRRQDS